MKNVILSLFIVVAAVSCEQKKTETINTNTSQADSTLVSETTEPRESSSVQNCYLSAVGKDSLFLSLDDNLGTLTGKMRYKNFQKDSSSGDVIGSKNGDTIKVNYTFQSEGMSSEREIYFLKKDGNLIEGIGEQKVEGSKSLYADAKKIKYESGHTLKSVDCTNFDKKFSSK